LDTTARWQAIVAKYQSSELKRSLWQIANSIIPFLLLWYVMLRSLEVGYWLTLLLAIPTAGFVVRIFIIFHDAGHGSFFKSSRANAVIGWITGLLTWTPYDYWRHDHAVHHATTGDLDRRGKGDVYTMTVNEYLAAPWWSKTLYRVTRSPLVMFTVGPLIQFIVINRFYPAGTGRRERQSVHLTNLALAAVIGVLAWRIGWQAFVLVELPVMLVASVAGVWVFYVQHNFDQTYFVRREDWVFFTAGMNGSSFYKLPRLLQWFTGNIGFHHIHHLSPKIPNYNLPKCYRDNPVFHVRPVTIRLSLKSLGYRLWDEQQQRLVGFRELKKYRARQMDAA
jgi:acyl-lipid omega-6 desaturase (Delta-12 desaturase)